jgi:hypothetical protein
MTRTAIPHDRAQTTGASATANAANTKSIDAPEIFQNKFMAQNGRNNVHNDSYMSDTYRVDGPHREDAIVREGEMGGLCVTITFDSLGRINTLATSPSGRHLLCLADPVTLSKLGRDFELPSEEGNHEWGGSGYFYLDADDHVVVPTITLQIWVLEAREIEFKKDGEEVDFEFKVVKSYDLADAIQAALDIRPHESLAELDNILSVLPDCAGNLWFVTKKGVIGYVEKGTEKIFTHLLENPDAKGEEDRLEGIGNSFVADEDGGVFIASDYALYRFEASSDGPQQFWRERYAHGVRPNPKPGQNSIGTGTTPTLTNIGDKKYVAIADNADPRMHVLVYRREREVGEKRIVCKHAVFPPFKGCTENSLICVNNSIIVENNYGYRGPQSVAGPLTTETGIARIDFDEDGGESVQVWINNDISVPSVVSKLSLTDGRIYTYAKKGLRGNSGGGPGWCLTALDFETGNVVLDVPVRNSEELNNHYAGLFLRPGGRAYVGVFEGIVSVSDE